MIFGLLDSKEEVIDNFHEHFRALEEDPDYYDEFEPHGGFIVRDCYGGHYVGIYPSNIPLDKTLNEVKADLCAKLKEYTGMDIGVERIGFHVDEVED